MTVHTEASAFEAGLKASTMVSTNVATMTDEERYEAVRRRAKAFDGVFWYSVRTTGVYCRPNCAARLARRENVAFHMSCEAAEAAGFRPCKRCRPTGLSKEAEHAAAVARACALIERAEDMPSLDALSRAAKLSPYHFHRTFKAVTGVTPKAYANARRAKRMTETLASAPTVTSAIYDAGYNASSRFYEDASARLGMTPSDWRKGGLGTNIRFAIGEFSLGSILVAATGKGICAILMGDDPEVLIHDLEDRFPNAELEGGDSAFNRLVAEVVGLVEAPGRGIELPLDIRGTAFQQQVWAALRAIPSGRTMNYTEVANAIGMPTAARAVAAACAANKIAIAIPCHRVVRSDGSLSGYRWGVERKRALLLREREAV